MPSYFSLIPFMQCNKTYRSFSHLEYLKYASCSQKAQHDSEACANKYKETMHFMKPNANQENHGNMTLTQYENIKTICW